MKCSKCNSEIKDGMKFCSKCGAEIPQKWLCPNCGTELKTGMKFCPKCGYSFDESIQEDKNNLTQGYSLVLGDLSCLFNYVKNDYNKKHPIKAFTPTDKSRGSETKRIIFASCILVMMFFVGFFLKQLIEKEHVPSKSVEQVYDNNLKKSDLELIEAVKHHHEIVNKIEVVLPQINRILREYGYGALGFIAAAQNNPHLFSTFESLNDDLMWSFDKLIRICEKNGDKELAREYRDKREKWSEGVRILRGNP